MIIGRWSGGGGRAVVGGILARIVYLVLDIWIFIVLTDLCPNYRNAYDIIDLVAVRRYKLALVHQIDLG